MNIGLIIFIALILAAALYVVSIFNRLVTLKHRTLNGLAQIEVQLKRRHDLIPKLVEVVKTAMHYEQETLQAVLQARSTAAGQLNTAMLNPAGLGAMQILGQSESALSGLLHTMMMRVEAYPDLKASQSMLQLSEELSTTENRIAFARQAYNDQTTTYNAYKQSFPQQLFATWFGHKQHAELLEFNISHNDQPLNFG